MCRLSLQTSIRDSFLFSFMFCLSVLMIILSFHRTVWFWFTVMPACRALPPSWLATWCWRRGWRLMMRTLRWSRPGRQFAPTPASTNNCRATNLKAAFTDKSSPLRFNWWTYKKTVGHSELSIHSSSSFALVSTNSWRKNLALWQLNS